MYIYAEQITPRVQYIVDTLFNGIAVTLTGSSKLFHGYKGVKISYAHKQFGNDELLMQPHGLLTGSTITKQQIVCSDWNGVKIFFQSKGDVPFDLFSAAFYLLSRYEEYLPHQKDSYGRFAHENSLAFKEGFLHVPLINIWMHYFFEILQQKFPEFIPPPVSFTFTPTYDIDIAYAYRGRSLSRKIFSLLRREETSVNGKDIFDVYGWLDQLHNKHRLSPVYFFLLAQRRSKYDKNLSPKSAVLQQLVRHISARHKVGIHPSWQSYHDETLMQEEVKKLENMIQKKAVDSRQHYIMLTLPHTFHCLIKAGITNDYSMGYGSINGFRASYALPFYWYDLMREQKTGLLLHPFCYMEANSFFEQKFTAEQAAEELQYYYDIIKRVNGQLITIFHNHFLTEDDRWKDWRKMYEDFLEKNFTSDKNATSPSLPE